VKAWPAVIVLLLVAAGMGIGLAIGPEVGQFTADGGVQLCPKGDRLITGSMLYSPNAAGLPTPEEAATSWAAFETERAGTQRAAAFLARAPDVEVRPLDDGEVAVLFSSDSPDIFLAYVHTLKLENGFVVDSAQVCESALFEE